MKSETITVTVAMRADHYNKLTRYAAATHRSRGAALRSLIDNLRMPKGYKARNEEQNVTATEQPHAA